MSPSPDFEPKSISEVEPAVPVDETSSALKPTKKVKLESYSRNSRIKEEFVELEKLWQNKDTGIAGYLRYAPDLEKAEEVVADQQEELGKSIIDATRDKVKRINKENIEMNNEAFARRQMEKKESAIDRK